MTTKQGARSPETKAAVYRFYDATGELLYVGLTHDIKQRWGVHERIQPWWLDVVKREFTWYETRSEAEQVEATALVQEKPRYDRSGTRNADGGQWDDRLALETGRAVKAVTAAIQDGTLPKWKILPPYAALSSTYGIPIAGVIRGLQEMRTAGSLVYARDRYAVAPHDDFPYRAVERYSVIHLLASKHFEDRPFTLTHAAGAIGLTSATLKRHLTKMIDRSQAECLPPAPRERELRYRIIRHPEPALPDRIEHWHVEDVRQLAAWVIQQLASDEKSFADDSVRLAFLARDRLVVQACLPTVVTLPSGSTYVQGSSPWGAPALLEMAFSYASRHGYQVEWLPERVDMRQWIVDREAGR